jgi:hypothetical protein
MTAADPVHCSGKARAREIASAVSWARVISVCRQPTRFAGERTRLTLEQDNAPADSVEEFRANWETMLGNLKALVERG